MKTQSHPSGRLIGALAFVLSLASAPAWAQGMIVNARDRSLGIYAINGATHNAALRLHNRCSPQTPECLWLLQNGVLYNGKTNLVVRAMSLQPGAPLVMSDPSQCGPNGVLCTWVYRDGMFVSYSAPQLAIVAAGGPRLGSELRLNVNCNPSIPECSWTRP